MGEIKPKDISKPLDEQLVKINTGELMPLPAPYDSPGMEPPVAPLKEEWREKYCTALDGFIGNDCLRRPESKERERELVARFLSGLDKLFSGKTNSGYALPFNLCMEYCTKCNTCSEACHIFLASGRQEIYRPIFRSEVLRRLYAKHKSRGLLSAFLGGDAGVNASAVLRLGELAYRCNLCRRCAQVCPLGLDNALIAREIRVLFSQELGIAPSMLHDRGTVLQLKTGSSTGINKMALADIIEFMEDDIGEKTGKSYKIPLDKKGADILLIHNAGEYISWPESPAAFAILFEEAGISWTLSSELAGYDAVNYGIWYDDVMTRRLALAQRKAARELGVRRIVIGECGHAHRAAAVSSDRLAAGSDNIPRESCFPLLWEIIAKKAVKFDPSKNYFPVTLHDPCNLVRSMGVVQPQRKILRAVCPHFREMTPCGVHNYCCGGGSGFAVMDSLNFKEWVVKVASRMKFKQILEAFGDTVADPGLVKYVCAPCSNCKGAMRDILGHYGATEKFNIRYGGVAELMVNAMAGLEKPYLEFGPGGENL